MLSSVLAIKCVRIAYDLVGAGLVTDEVPLSVVSVYCGLAPADAFTDASPILVVLFVFLGAVMSTELDGDYSD